MKSILKTLFLITIATSIFFSNNAHAETREIEIFTPFPKIEFTTGQKIQFQVTIVNKGSQPEILNVKSKGPEGWEILMKSDLYAIKSIYLRVNESRTFTVDVTTLPEQHSGNYTITITSESVDSIIKETLDLYVELPLSVTESGITLIASYPSLEGSIGEEFEFRMNVINKANKDNMIFFTAVHPENWDVNFHPRFGGSSIIRSLEFPAGGSDVIVIDVIPPINVEPGAYDVSVLAETEDIRESLTFTVYIIGSYSLRTAPSNNRLSLEAAQGKANIVSINITNTGSAPLEKIVMFSDKPTGWDVDFELDEIPILDRGESRQIRVNIVPPSDAIPGDYAITLYSAVQARGISITLNYRVTVTGSVGWGFLGLGIIAFLAILLVAIVIRLGRR
jgi:uncharacterized membrane protein